MQADFVTALSELVESNRPFAIATVIDVDGSASARVGSRALLNERGTNVYGWIGGGCAESFVGEQAVEAIGARACRTVFVNLDDEVFGLGVACGGTMRVFVEPHVPPQPVELARPVPPSTEEEMRFLAAEIDIEPVWMDATFEVSSVADLVLELATALARSRGRSAGHLRDQTRLIRFRPVGLRGVRSALIVGQSRITEAVAQYLVRLECEVTVCAPRLDPAAFPSDCRCVELPFSSIPYNDESITIIGSHHAADSEIVRRALAAGAPYVAVIASRSRTAAISEALGWHRGDVVEAPVFAPAGVDLDSRTPREIALSIAAEIVRLGRPPAADG